MSNDLEQPVEAVDAAEQDDAAEATTGEEEVTDLSNSDVTTKYQEAAKIANLALTGVMQQAVSGARIADLCKFGDTVIEQRCAQIFRNKVKGRSVEKGVAFPTCVSVNECVCNFSPLDTDAESASVPPLADGDWVKIELGCHVDGFVAVVAHTIKVGGGTSSDAEKAEKEANVMLAAYQAAELAAATIAPGVSNSKITEEINKVAKSYGVKFITGARMHQMKQYIINGNKTVNLRDDDAKPEATTFAANEVYAVNVAVSSGEGKPKEGRAITTIYKRAVDKKYRLKMESSRNVFNQINSKFPTLPFCLRAIDDKPAAVRMGIKECITHELLEPYPVLHEPQGDVVAHVKFTVLLLPSGTVKITGLPIDYSAYRTDKKLDEDVAAVLKSAEEKAEAKKQKKKDKKKKASGAGSAAISEAKTA